MRQKKKKEKEKISLVMRWRYPFILHIGALSDGCPVGNRTANARKHTHSLTASRDIWFCCCKELISNANSDTSFDT